MKHFKVKASRYAERYEITRENFERVTGCKEPFEQIKDTGRASQYAICPSCLNPIQIIGLVQEIKSKPYGRHSGKNINGFPAWNERKYEYCPYADRNKRRQPNEDELLREITDSVIELYNLLREQFDRVVYVISKELGIRCSTMFWRKVLNQFLVNEVYFYPWLTESNLPYIFELKGMQHQNILGQKFLIGTQLYNAIEAHNNVSFEVDEKNPEYARLKNAGTYLNLQVRFYGHRQKAVEGEELSESMFFCVDDMDSDEEIYRTRLTFNETYFPNLIKDSKNENRQLWLLDIAKDMMKGIEN